MKNLGAKCVKTTFSLEGLGRWFFEMPEDLSPSVEDIFTGVSKQSFDLGAWDVHQSLRCQFDFRKQIKLSFIDGDKTSDI